MNDHHSTDAKHTEFLGESHPNRDIQHGHLEKVHGKNCTEWTVEWLDWLLKMSYDDSPLVSRGDNPFDRHYNSLVPSKADKEKGVMFYATSVYGSNANSYTRDYVVVPLGEWDLFFVPYMVYNSKLEYPSLDEDELYNLAKRQINSTYKLEVSLDGIGLECCRVPLAPKKDSKMEFVIDHIPTKNVLGLEPAEMTGDVTAKMVGDGYACFLNPLTPGMHLLTLKAYSSTYYLDSVIQLNVRGPRKKPKVSK